MAIELSSKIINAIRDKDSIVLLSAIGKDGTPYNEVAVKIDIRPDGKIAYYVLLESSQIQKNLVFSIWFKKEVSISLITKEKEHFLIKGQPYQALIAGNEFQEEYIKVQEEFGENTDLSTVWLIEPEYIIEETYSIAKKREEEEYPLLIHLDRVFREEII